MATIETIFYFILALGILVFIHEWGHYIVAHKSGVKVEKFSIGFGPKIFSFMRGNTEFQISIIPLGGFVKLFGQDPLAEAEGDEKQAELIANHPESFSKQPLFNRMATVFAGPVMNLILFIFLMPIVYMVGIKVPAILDEKPTILSVNENTPASEAGFQMGDTILSIDGDDMRTWENVSQWVLIHPNKTVEVEIERKGQNKTLKLTTSETEYDKIKAGFAGFEPNLTQGIKPFIGTVSPDSPAERAGFQSKDIITKIDGNLVQTWEEMTKIIKSSEGKELSIEFLRDNEINHTKIKPEFNSNAETWIVGISQTFFKEKKFGFIPAIKAGLSESVELTKMMMKVLKLLFTGNMSIDSLQGPLQIAKASGEVAKAGLGEFLKFMAFLSLQLGILNLLPIPVLDGGHAMFMAFEGIFRKPVPYKIQNTLTHIGMFLLLFLMVYVTANDANRMFGIKEFFTNLF